jgi:uroporphyrinogen-III synthase
MDTIVLTASAGSFSGLAEALREIPARVIERPLVSFGPPEDWTPLDEALEERGRYGSLALTSPRAAAAVADRIRALGINWEDGPHPRVWTVGSATAHALGGSIPAVERNLPESVTAEVLARAMLAKHAPGPVLFPCGERRRDELPAVLREAGLEVHEVVCYRTLLASPAEALAAMVGATMVVAASPTVVGLLLDSCPPFKLPALVAIGPTTAAAARAGGWHPAAVPDAPSTASLATAIAGLLTHH